MRCPVRYFESAEHAPFALLKSRTRYRAASVWVPPQVEQRLGTAEEADKVDSPDIHLAASKVVADTHLADTQVAAVVAGSCTLTDNHYTQPGHSFGHLGYYIRMAGWVYVLEAVTKTGSKWTAEEESLNPGNKGGVDVRYWLGDEEDGRYWCGSS